MTPDQAYFYKQLTDLQKHTANAHIAGATNGEAHEIACSILGREPASNARQAGHEAITAPNAQDYIESVLAPIVEITDARDEAAADSAIAGREEILEFFTEIMRADVLEKTAVRDMTKAERRAFSGLDYKKYGTIIKQHSQTDAAKQIVEMQGHKVAPKAPVGPDGETAPGIQLVIDPLLYEAARKKMLNKDDC